MRKIYFVVRNRLMQLLRLKDGDIRVDCLVEKIVSMLFRNVKKLMNGDVFDGFYFPFKDQIEKKIQR